MKKFIGKLIKNKQINKNEINTDDLYGMKKCSLQNKITEEKDTINDESQEELGVQNNYLYDLSEMKNNAMFI